MHRVNDVVDLMIWPEPDVPRAIRGTATHTPDCSTPAHNPGTRSSSSSAANSSTPSRPAAPARPGTSSTMSANCSANSASSRGTTSRAFPPSDFLDE